MEWPCLKSKEAGGAVNIGAAVLNCAGRPRCARLEGDEREGGLQSARGKLLRAEVEVESGPCSRASVDGDFFAHPEEDFEAAEAELAGLPADRLGDAALSLFSRPPPRPLRRLAPRHRRALLEEAAREAQAR